MKLPSFARLFGDRWSQKSNSRGRKKNEARKRTRLWVETLEKGLGIQWTPKLVLPEEAYPSELPEPFLAAYLTFKLA